MAYKSATQGFDQLPRRRQDVTTLRRSTFAYDLHQRGHAGRAACGMALRAGGSAPNITAFHLRKSVAMVSGQCRVPQCPGTTRLSRGFGEQRGHVSPPVAALRGNGTSPLDPVRCSVVSVSGHGGVPPCPSTTRLSRGVRGSCSACPLRPPASLLHNAALPSVPASRCAKAPLGAGHRFAPCRVKATGVMQSGLRWSRSHSRRRFPVVGTPYAPPSARPCGYRGTWGIGQALRAVWLVSGLRPVVWCVPPPTLVLRRCAASALRAGLPVRPP